MPVILGSVGETIWSSKTRRTITLTCGMIATILTAYSQIKANANDIAYIIPAHRGYVHYTAEQIIEKHEKEDKAEFAAQKLAQAEVQRVLSRVERGINDGKREAAQNDLFKAGLEMKKAVKADDDDQQQYIQREVIRLQQTLEKLDAQSKSLSEKN